MTDINLEIFRARTTVLNLFITQDDLAYNLANCKLWLTAKRAFTDLDSVAIFQLSSPSSGIEITSEADGEAQATIAATDTSELPYSVTMLKFDVQLQTATGELFPVASGMIKVKPNVTRATS